MEMRCWFEYDEDPLLSSPLHRPCPLPPWLWASTAPPSLRSSSSSNWPTIGCTWCSTRARRWFAAASLTSARLRRRKVMPRTPACPPASGKSQQSYVLKSQLVGSIWSSWGMWAHFYWCIACREILYTFNKLAILLSCQVSHWKI